MLKLCEENEIKKKNNVKMNNWLRIKKKKTKSELDALTTW
jgi:hypothetical protein